MKTGHTDSAGYCLVSTAMRGDRRILVVVVGTDSEATRAEESLKLLNWSFQNFDTVKLFDKSQPGIDARVWEGTVETVKLGPPNRSRSPCRAARPASSSRWRSATIR